MLVASIATYPDVITKRTTSRPEIQACILFGLAPDGVYQANRVTTTAGALLPHRFTLTTRPQKSEPFGGILSVALSLVSRPVDVIDHPVLWSPDFPPAASSERSPHPLTMFNRMIDSGQPGKVQSISVRHFAISSSLRKFEFVFFARRRVG